MNREHSGIVGAKAGRQCDHVVLVGWKPPCLEHPARGRRALLGHGSQVGKWHPRIPLAADDEAVYWLTACYSPCEEPECPYPQEGGQIARADAGGTVTVLAEGECEIAGALHSDGASVYWAMGRMS